MAEGSAADGSVNYTLGHTPDAEYVYHIYRDGKKEGTYHSVDQAREIMGNMKLTSPNREYKIKRGARNKMAGPASQLPEQGMTKGHGNFAGDRPVNLGGVSMKKIQIGDTVRYIDQRAQVVDMSRDREHARITIPSSATTKTVLTSDLRQLGRGVSEGNDQQLSVQQLATVSDEALDTAYGYGRSSPGNTFGWQANLKSAAYAKQMIDQGVTDIEAISDAIHQGWNTTAQAFVQNPEQFDDTEKLRAAGKLEAKLQQRAKLMNIDYDQLPDDEQEKDRVVARALLQALTGQQDAATDNKQLDELSPATLARYKTKAGAAATAADSAGDRKTGDRRFSGIVKATKKQFDQDAKQSAQAVHESRLRLMASIIKTQ
jgi:pyruvate/2-oxoglutarate dehydrogenase complex dihydrolipoamide acyltransferase (E2) component